ARLPRGRLDGLAEAALRPGLVERLGQQQLTLEAVKLGLLEPVVVLLREAQRLVQRLPRVPEPAGLCVGVDERGEVVRKSHPRTGGPVGIETLEELRQRLLRPAL